METEYVESDADLLARYKRVVKMIEDRMKRKGHKTLSGDAARFLGSLNFLKWQMESEMKDRGLEYDNA